MVKHSYANVTLNLERIFLITLVILYTSAPTRADTEPPPGAAVLAPTLFTNSITVLFTRRPESDDGRQYSMILSLKYFVVILSLSLQLQAKEDCLTVPPF